MVMVGGLMVLWLPYHHLEMRQLRRATARSLSRLSPCDWMLAQKA